MKVYLLVAVVVGGVVVSSAAVGRWTGAHLHVAFLRVVASAVASVLCARALVAGGLGERAVVRVYVVVGKTNVGRAALRDALCVAGRARGVAAAVVRVRRVWAGCSVVHTSSR